jgi:hypothetical protein
MTAKKIFLHPTTPDALKQLLLKPAEVRNHARLTASHGWDPHLKIIAGGNNVDFAGAGRNSIFSYWPRPLPTKGNAL